MGFDLSKVAQGVRLILEGIGEDPESLRFKGTPERVAGMFSEVLGGVETNPETFLRSLSNEVHDEMVILRDIPLYSMCEHHLLPFFGHASVAYIPQDGRIIGLNTIAQLVDVLARRLQIQERLTKQITDYLVGVLRPRGVMTVICAEHLCMTMRGAKKPGAKTITSAVRGVFRNQPATRQEAMSLLVGPTHST
jgi:GTP cyclohydrolase I